MKHLNNIEEISFEVVVGITVKKENEISKFLDEIINFLPENYLVVLFFDKSRDIDTFKICKQKAKLNKYINIIYDESVENLADAYFKLYKHCSNINTKWVISINAGWRHDPKDLKKFMEISNKNEIDCIWGYRNKNTNQSNFIRRFVSFTGNFLSDILLDIKIKDLTSGFYMIRGNILKIELSKMKKFISKYHFFDTELKFYLKNYSYDQVKINYKSPNKTLPIKIIYDSLIVLFKLIIKKI